MNAAIIILAAGSSKRMGRPKQLLPWKDTNLLGHAIDNARKSEVKQVYVVLGANAETIKGSVRDEEVQLTVNPNWAKGMGSSISRGMAKALKSETKWDAVLIMLSDQPMISADYLDKLIHTFKEKNSGIIATKYPKGMGVPAVFSQKYFPHLLKLEADKGAKSIILQNSQDTFALDSGDLHLDIDTPEDYRNLQSL
ncbi:nucleotidyltransferase family protein [Poritiphilus flavus]|uniref:NTP transferase domain-containing protein n=1 Tax=Poritiphilus flavus TaxID=2697053 RepID=A0A6L9EEQ0_9FLAO|nr:nucleotidyltransferase family protein [Poritiphilus flavus]NAS13225.1 NTP transferase domain-containing protein [Poritiphilus flavus]